MARHTLSHSVDLYSGEAVMNGWLGSKRGLPIDLLILDDLGTPDLADINALALNATAGNQATAEDALFILDGVKGSAVAGTQGTVTLDVARGIQIISSGADTRIARVVGTDKFGNALEEDITFNGNNAVLGKKAFKKVSTVTCIGGAMTNNADIGTSDLIGLTYRCEVAGDLVAIYENDILRTSRVVATAATVTQTSAATETITASGPSITQVAVTDSLDGATFTGTALTTSSTPTVDELETNFGVIGLQLNAAGTDIADNNSEIDAILVDLADFKVAIDQCVVDLAAYKVEIDKLVLDVNLGTQGSFIKADKTAGTRTTGDVRGTYDPVMTLDGSKKLKVLIRPQARTSLGAYGVAQGVS